MMWYNVSMSKQVEQALENRDCESLTTTTSSRLQQSALQPQKAKRKKKLFWQIFKWIFICGLLGIVIAVVIVTIKVYPLLKDLPSPDELVNAFKPENSSSVSSSTDSGAMVKSTTPMDILSVMLYSHF